MKFWGKTLIARFVEIHFGNELDIRLQYSNRPNSMVSSIVGDTPKTVNPYIQHVFL